MKKISCYVSISDEGEFEVSATRKQAKIKAQEMKGFDISAKVFRAKLLIYENNKKRK